MSPEQKRSITTESQLQLQPEVIASVITQLEQNPPVFTQQMHEKLSFWTPELEYYLKIGSEEIDLDYRQDYFQGAAVATKVIMQHGIAPRTSCDALQATDALIERSGGGDVYFELLENCYPKLYLQIDNFATKLKTGRTAFLKGFITTFDPLERTIIGDELVEHYAIKTPDLAEYTATSESPLDADGIETSLALKIDSDYLGILALNKLQYTEFVRSNLSHLAKQDRGLHGYIENEAIEYSDQELQAAFLLGAAAAVDLLTEGMGEHPRASKAVIKIVEDILIDQYSCSPTNYFKELCQRYPELKKLIAEHATQAYLSAQEGHAFIEGFTQLFGPVEQQIQAEELEKLY